MKKIIKLFLLLLLLLLLLFTSSLFAQTNTDRLEKTDSFFPKNKEINQDEIGWYYLTVPENWENPSGKSIKIAVVILKNKSGNKSSNPLVYIEGGPGGGGINGIRNWLKHPIRGKNDIILVDVRGTGNSLPKLCPDLGKKFLEILSKNQNSAQDEQQKMLAAMACKQDLISRDIDLNAYNSKSIAKDLNTLKTVLKFQNWNVYGVSYGTYVAQVYANDFPQDIKSLILDSSISDISEYYNSNTANYMSSLNKVFDACKSDPDCNKKYPNLEEVYFETIEKLDQKPVTVKVNKKILPNGTFTYNAEDFKVAIQQGLYSRKLIEVIPLLIYEFNKANKNTLSSLVAAFSGALRLDYGQYYCVSCNEAVPNNSLEIFNTEAQKYEKLKGGLSFYRSDFLVCQKWNLGDNDAKKSLNDLSNLSSLNAPVLVFSGAFDPITPASNGIVTAGKFKNSYLIKAPISGHVPGFSKLGSKYTDEFIENPGQRPDTKELESNNKVIFITDVNVNAGVSSFANTLNEFDFLFFAPLFIAVIILLISIFNFCYTLIRNKKEITPNKLIKCSIIITSLLGLSVIVGLILAINNTAQNNFYILAFGLPSQFDYLFVIQWTFIVFTIISVLYFVLKVKSISNTSVVAAILFSLVLIGVYFQYWGFLF